MIIQVDGHTSIQEIKDAFSNAFPYLSIEFFTEGHGWAKPSAMGKRVAADKSLDALRISRIPASLEVHGWHTTGGLEQEFGNIFGLHVQVFRREGQAWIQTTDTDGRTLEEQNEAGRNASQELLDGTDQQFNYENRE